MFLSDREFRENDERKGREEEKQRVGVATSSHLAPTVEYIFPRPCTSSWSSLSSLWGSHGLSLVGRAVTGGGTFCGMPGVGSHQPHSLNNRV